MSMRLTITATVCLALQLVGCASTTSEKQPVPTMVQAVDRLPDFGMAAQSRRIPVEEARSGLQPGSQPQMLPQMLPQLAPRPESLIAQDFVNALRQLTEVAPYQTTVSLRYVNSSDPFTFAMSQALEKAGYGTRWVLDQDERLQPMFRYSKASQRSVALTTNDLYEIAVGIVELRREYATNAERRVQPITPLYVRGADASAVVLNDDIFDVDKRVSASANGPVNPDHSVRATRLTPLQSTSLIKAGLQNSSALKLPDAANPLNGSVASAASARELSMPVVGLQREQNVFDLGGSNYDDMFSSRIVVTETLLTFANDSMRLGQRNKQLVEQMVESFDPRTDIFSVIGCSIGPTEVNGGNAALALGRAGRVAEALRFAGVNDTHILDEGCWSADGKLGAMPSRGVVLTLKRKA